MVVEASPQDDPDGLSTPRARYRAQVRDEVKRIAWQQLDNEGPSAVSLNGIARVMGVSGPALYRYFASRDDLMAGLVTDAYDDLATAVELAVGTSVSLQPGDQLRALGNAYRAWALANPNRYRLLFANPLGSGRLAPEQTIPASYRTMAALFQLLARAIPEATTRAAEATTLGRQLEARARDRPGPQVSGLVARRGLTWWTRLHGVIMLELEGHFASMGFDPSLLYETELDQLLAEVR